MAFPLSVIVWGEPVTLSMTLIAAVNEPTAVGINVAVIVQVEPTATVAQLFVCVKRLAFVPPTATLATTSGTLPELVTVIGCDDDAPTLVFANVTAVGAKVAPGTAGTANPLSARFCEVPAALPVTASDAE